MLALETDTIETAITTTNCTVITVTLWLYPGGASGKELSCQCRRHKRTGFDPWVGKIPWGRVWQPTPVFLPGDFHRQRSLVGYGPQDRKESYTTEAT